MARSKFYYFVRKIYRKVYRFMTLRVLYPACYKRNARKKLDEYKVVFIEVRMPEISDSFSLIYDRIKACGRYLVKEHFLRMSFVNKFDYYKSCKRMIKDIADAKYVFLNEASDVFAALPIRKDTVVTQTWHACGAFKKFGLSTAELIFGDDRKTLEKYPYHGNYTHMTVSSPEVVWAYEEAMGLEKGIVKPTGISRTDVFFDKDRIKRARKHLEEIFGAAKGKRIILYAPTFRGRVASAKTPNKLSMPLMNYVLSRDYVLVTKHHPFVKKRPEIPEQYKDFAMDVTDTMSIEELLMVADICISDYSSLVFEYSIYEKPMLFFAYDLDEYYDWRGFYYDYKEFVPGEIVYTTEEIVDYITHVDERFNKQQVIDFREKYMSSCDGHSTDRILDLLGIALND